MTDVLLSSYCAAAVNAGLNLELSYGLRKNIFTLIPEAVAQGNITMEVGAMGQRQCQQKAWHQGCARCWLTWGQGTQAAPGTKLGPGGPG